MLAVAAVAQLLVVLEAVVLVAEAMLLSLLQERRVKQILVAVVVEVEVTHVKTAATVVLV